MSRTVPTVVILTLIILVSHGLGSLFSLYEAISWFDMVMHALGGAWLAAVSTFLLARRFPKLLEGRPRRSRIAAVALLVLAGGALWELYELAFAAWTTATYGDLGFYQPWIDTVSDLVLDVLGAVAVALFLLPKEREVARA